MVQEHKLKSFFDQKAKEREYWIKKNIYYNHKISDIYRFHIPNNKKILEIGCGTGFLLNSLKPLLGVGIDFSIEMIKIAKKKYPKLIFICDDAETFKLEEKFDYVVISDTLGYFEDIQKVFSNIRKNCTNDTRIIINSYNTLWEPALNIFSSLGLKMHQPFTNWLAPEDISNLLALEGFDTIKITKKIIMPMHIPLLSGIFNKIVANLPVINSFCLTSLIVARPMHRENNLKSVSIVIAARNEEGNIDTLVRRIPKLCDDMELIFVEGGSEDNTYKEIIKAKEKYKDKYKIKLFRQDGKGKGDAVRKGFDKATKDILIILDADMSVPPEDLNKFYDAIVANKGEFINGSRLVYPMEKQAMRTLNLIGNTIFSLIFTWLLEQRFKDTLCGTKVIGKKNYEKLKINRAYFGDFDPFGDFDLIFGASKMDMKIIEVPIRYRCRVYGDTNIQRFKHGLILLKMCLFATKKIKFI